MNNIWIYINDPSVPVISHRVQVSFQIPASSAICLDSLATSFAVFLACNNPIISLGLLYPSGNRSSPNHCCNLEVGITPPRVPARSRKTSHSKLHSPSEIWLWYPLSIGWAVESTCSVRMRTISKKSKPPLKSPLELRAVEACWSRSSMRLGSGAVDGFPSGWTKEPSWAIMRDPRWESDWRSKVHDGWGNKCIASSDPT